MGSWRVLHVGIPTGFPTEYAMGTPIGYPRIWCSMLSHTYPMCSNSHGTTVPMRISTTYPMGLAVPDGIPATGTINATGDHMGYPIETPTPDVLGAFKYRSVVDLVIYSDRATNCRYASSRVV